jgi:anthranilate phosphoribosyltransferase
MTTWPELLTVLLARQDLTRADCAWAMEQVMLGEASPTQLAGFLVALRAKGETVTEVTGLVEAMLRHAVRIEVPGPIVDVVGTGGDRFGTVNISTMASLVVAGAGPRVVKHGNRAASSASGSADVLEALGVRLDLPPTRVAELAAEVGITFCFAAVFHPSMRNAAVARAELGVPTVFNVLGPLANPARPRHAAVGCADRRMAPVMAGVLAERGVSALVFRGEDGLDELATTGPAQVWQVIPGELGDGPARVVPSRFDPAELGLAPATIADLRGGDAAHNARVARDFLGGAPGPVRDTVLLEAAAGLVAAAAVPPGTLNQRLAAGFTAAAEAVDSGAAAQVLERWVRASRS